MAFKKITPDSQDIPVAGESAALAPQAPSTPAEYYPDQYDDTSRDVEVPVLGLVNGIGPLAKKFRNQAGKFVLGDTLLGEAVSVIPVAVAKYFSEKARDGKEIKYGTPEAATRKTFATASEAAKAGYVLDFDNKARNRIEEVARVGYLVVAPEGADPIDFALRAPGGLRLALAKCTYQRGGYRKTFRPLFDYANRLALSEGTETKGLTHTQLFAAAKPWRNVWTLTPTEETKQDNTWFEPQIARGAPLTQETIDWITQNYGSVRA
jgi:hypothetical protein